MGCNVYFVDVSQKFSHLIEKFLYLILLNGMGIITVNLGEMKTSQNQSKSKMGMAWTG